ncbi:MAG TPA: hypothetical protein ENI05_13250 [Porticoccus sp.]|nr:hypothetical protein [Porticoccus sp.]
MARKTDEERLVDTIEEIEKLKMIQKELEKKIKAKNEADRQKNALKLADIIEGEGVTDLSDPKVQEIIKNALRSAATEA